MMAKNVLLTVVVTFAGILAGMFGAPITVVAQNASPNVTFDHKGGTAKIFDLEVENGETFLVHITNTCPDEFNYPYVAVERGAIRPEAEGTKKPLGTHAISVVYDDRFGGYVFTVERKDGVTPGSKCEDGENLKPTSFIVSVQEQDWHIGFSGGFTFSGLNSPVFGLKTENNVKTIVAEPDKKDKVRLGAASFVHVFHDRLPWLAPAFGLGINADNKAEYFAGIGLRLGDKATVNVGSAFGSISRLPNGITSTTPITDDNVLNNLGSRVVGSWFFALSYSFIDTKDRLKKPFAVEPPAAGGATTANATAKPNPNQKIVETLAGSADTYDGIAEIKAAAPCRAEAKPGDGNAMTVIVHVKDATKLPKPDDAVRTSATAALQKRIQASIKENPPTVKPALTFGTSCQ